jgi:hypothetical protein
MLDDVLFSCVHTYVAIVTCISFYLAKYTCDLTISTTLPSRIFKSPEHAQERILLPSVS